MGMKEMVEEASAILIMKNEQIDELMEENRRLRQALEQLKVGGVWRQKTIQDALEPRQAS